MHLKTVMSSQLAAAQSWAYDAVAQPDHSMVGFTGTQDLRRCEWAVIEAIIDNLPADARVVTGGCIGVDAAAAQAAKARGLYVHTVLPAKFEKVDPYWQSWCDTFEMVPASKDGHPYRPRNVRLVAWSKVLYVVAAYAEQHPRSIRSGTWMTARIAKRAGVPIEARVLR